MTEADSLLVLLTSTGAIAVVHALAPDHWVPFASIARAQGWSRGRLFWVTLVSGLGHVGSSLVIGSLGLLLGLSLANLGSLESQRGEVAGLLLIGFGVAYAVWGLKHMHRHRNARLDARRSVTIWTLVAIFVLGPCEPLIPLMFLGAAHSWAGVLLISLVFGLVTLIMMVGLAWLAYTGTQLFNASRIEPYNHAIAGVVIALTGGMVMFLGI